MTTPSSENPEVGYSTHMRIAFLLRVLTCIVIASLFVFLYLNKNNRVAELMVDLPALQQEIEVVRETNAVLQYEIDRFESPLHLMELHRRPEFRYLKYPREDEILYE